jgi:uncharacterized membrane protein
MMTNTQPEGDFFERLPAEVDTWQNEGLIALEQGAAILARYDLRTGKGAARAFRLGSVATFVSIVGSLVLGIGVIIFFAAHWTAIPDWVRVLLVVGATAIAFTAGYLLQYRWTVMPRVGGSLMFLGALLFQAGLFLVAQIYNIPTDSPLLLLLGTIGIMPLAYATASRLILILGLVDGLIWLGWELAQLYPNSPQNYAVPLMYILAGVLVYSAGRLHHLRPALRRFDPIYQVMGLLAIFVPVYALSFYGVWDQAQHEHLASLHVPLWFVGAIGLAILAAGTLLVGRRGDWLASLEAAIFAGIALVVGLVAFRPEWAGAYTLLFNGVFFGLAVLVGMRGYLEREVRFVNLGIGFLALGLFSRYIDVCAPLLPQSLFFMLGGLFLLVVAGTLEWVRRRLLCGIRVPAGHSLGLGV